MVGETFEFECERCGKVVPYEEMYCVCDMYVCKDCHREMVGRFVFLEEDDGYED